MSGQDMQLEPELASFLKRPKGLAPMSPELRARIVERARATVSARGAKPAAGMVRHDSPRTFVMARRPRPLIRASFAAAVAVVAGTVGAVAALRGREDVGSASGASEKIVGKVSTIPHAASTVPSPLADNETSSDASAPIAPAGEKRRRAVHAVDPLGAELRVLHPAQEAFERRDWTGALRSLAEHARIFPHGHLAEEREALRVECLVRLGKTTEARKTANAFVAHFPNSVLLSRVRVSTE